MFASTWQRTRRPWGRKYGGPGSALYKSSDGGNTWRKIGNGFPTGEIGRISIAISPTHTDQMYCFVTRTNGFLRNIYRSSDGGESWTAGDVRDIRQASFMYWFGKIVINPLDPNHIYISSYHWWESKDGGLSWTQLDPDNVHVDQHGLVLDPADTSRIFIANDGGFYYRNSQTSPQFIQGDGIPITQFYRIHINPHDPNDLMGGTQDNGTNRNYGQNQGDWFHIYGGDGFWVEVHPDSPNIVFAESQYGFLGVSRNNGARFARIRPDLVQDERFNWNAPFKIDPHNTQRIYFGGTVLYRSDNLGTDWQVQSPDLTGGPGGNLTFGTITYLDISPVDSNHLAVGTDDGRVWTSSDQGASWSLVSDKLPLAWVTSVKFDPTDANALYATYSGYRYHNAANHVFYSPDMGQNWIDISGNLPSGPVNDIVIDPENNQHLIVATDFGVYHSLNSGSDWKELADGLPVVVVNHLAFHAPTRKLVAGTFGRSMYSTTLEDISVHSTNHTKSDFKVFPNPALEQIHLKFEITSGGIAEIRSLHGNLILSMNFYGDKLSLDLNDILPGSYILTVKAEGKSISKKFIKL